ncbi:hypothetical protein HanPSC8_Chr03g0120231 [Helianthus annuus]|nr:hypothetical protein HanPSC8_Chr03g0120231 [Helianthus annuus]
MKASRKQAMAVYGDGNKHEVFNTSLTWRVYHVRTCSGILFRSHVLFGGLSMAEVFWREMGFGHSSDKLLGRRRPQIQPK